MMAHDPAQILCADIGSTRTKAALFALSGPPDDETILLNERLETDTDPERIDDGLFELLDHPAVRGRFDHIRITSSAHGGLSMVVIGLVPDLTMHVAREAALSAGARLTGSYSYLLTHEDREQLEAVSPDIILLTGGTDGGNARYILENARMLASAVLPDTVVIYAGNRSVKSEILRILSHKEDSPGSGVSAVIAVDNVLPDLESPRVDHVQETIREVFLHTIIRGKGLDRVVTSLAVIPDPTPHAVFGFVQALWDQRSGDPSREFCLVDLGGATTDWYSASPAVPLSAVGADEVPTVLRGIEEPVVRRTVEADLGMRVSASSVPEALSAVYQGDASFVAYCGKVSRDIAYLPVNRQEMGYDALLAGGCLTLAAYRHSGSRKPIYTHDGTLFLQRGKDLRSIPTILATGGALARIDEIALPPCSVYDPYRQEERLVPEDPTIIRDKEYVIPLLAPLAQGHPAAVNRFVRETFTTELPVKGSFRQITGSYGGSV